MGEAYYMETENFDIWTPDNSDGYALVQDLARFADDVDEALTSVRDISGLIKGTRAEREAYPASSIPVAWLFAETDAGQLYQGLPNKWGRIFGGDSGVFTGATSSAGLATVNHGLGTTPASVLITDTNFGAIPGRRKIVFSTSNTTQIQFVVYDPETGSPLGSNPVSFFWLAIR